jgi:hypothetical protein
MSTQSGQNWRRKSFVGMNDGDGKVNVDGRGRGVQLNAPTPMTEEAMAKITLMVMGGALLPWAVPAVVRVMVEAAS